MGTVDKYEITHLGISPTLIRALMAKGDEYVNKHSLKSLEVFASTGEPWNQILGCGYLKRLEK